MQNDDELLLRNLAITPPIEKSILTNSQARGALIKKNQKKRKKRRTRKEYQLKEKKTSSGESSFEFTEEDIHPDAFDPTKKIQDYTAFIKDLESLIQKNNILEYCNQMNHLANQIADLEPQQQLEKYFTLLLNNLNSEAEIIHYFCLTIIKIYSSHFKEHDKKKLLKTRISDLFETFVLPLTHPKAQKKLEQVMQKFMSLHQSNIHDEINNTKNDDFLYTFSPSLPSFSPTEDHAIWKNPTQLTLPRDTTCYTLLNNQELVASTYDGNLFQVDLKDKKQKTIHTKNNPKHTNIPYYIFVKLHKKGNKKTEHLKILKAKPASTPTYFLNAFHCYFLGKESGKIIVQNRKAKKIHKLIGHKNKISGLVPLNDSSHRFLASSSHDTTIKIWDFASEICVQTLKSSIGEIEALAQTSPELLIALSKRKFLEVWNVSNKRISNKIRVIETVYSPVLSMVGYENYCLTGLSNSTLLVWEPKKGLCIEEIEIEGQLPIAKLSSDGHRVIAAQETKDKKILTLFMKKDE